MEAFEKGKDKSVNSNFQWPKCDQLFVAGANELNEMILEFCKPELMFKNVDTNQEYDLNELETLLGTIKILVAPLQKVDNLPSFIFDREFISKARVILAKLTLKRFNSLYSQIKVAKTSMPAEFLSELDRVHEYVNKSFSSSIRENFKSTFRIRFAYYKPYLNNSEKKFLATYLGALSWRIRGGGLWEKFDGTQSLRKYFGGKVFANLIEMMGGHRNVAQDFSENMMNRLQYKGWSDWFDMGTAPGEDVFHDLMQMTRRGMYQVGVGTYYGPLDGFFHPTSAVETLKNAGYDSTALEIAGAQMGNCYFYTKENLGNVEVGEKLEYPLSKFIHNFKSFGEVCFGAVLGTGIYHSFK